MPRKIHVAVHEARDLSVRQLHYAVKSELAVKRSRLNGLLPATCVVLHGPLDGYCERPVRARLERASDLGAVRGSLSLQQAKVWPWFHPVR